jgi:lipopolysaccharide transport system ATP-binding protein
MSELAIITENLSKQYQIGRRKQRYGTLADTLVESFKDFAAHGFKKLPEETIWALKDVNVEVERGEVIGVIGSNGAGKSTLLKILSRITEPTSGRAVITGRVGSLLEVATGFHPELTGRENIYLNGAILGMKRVEINQKFDEIVSFAEIDQFLDTPVKRYSSGMYVRLAFSVAAHLEPEILLVDEVLAVGDAGFQKKCIGKMGDVAQEGRTVLFVSHNMGAIRHLCSRALLLEGGQLVANGATGDVINQHLARFIYIAAPSEWVDLSSVPRQGNNEARFVKFRYSSMSADQQYRAYSHGPLDLTLAIQADIPRPVSSIAITLYDDFGTKLVNADTVSLDQTVYLNQGMNLVRFTIRELYLSPGVYTLGCWLANPPGEVYDWFKAGVNIEVVDADSDGSGIRVDGAVVCQFDVAAE